MKTFHFKVCRKDKIVTLEELESFYGRENDVGHLRRLLYRIIRGLYPEELEGCFSEYIRILWAEAPIGPMSFSDYLICFPPIEDNVSIYIYPKQNADRNEMIIREVYCTESFLYYGQKTKTR